MPKTKHRTRISQITSQETFPNYFNPCSAVQTPALVHKGFTANSSTNTKFVSQRDIAVLATLMFSWSPVKWITINGIYAHERTYMSKGLFFHALSGFSGCLSGPLEQGEKGLEQGGRRPISRKGGQTPLKQHCSPSKSQTQSLKETRPGKHSLEIAWIAWERSMA